MLLDVTWLMAAVENASACADIAAGGPANSNRLEKTNTETFNLEPHRDKLPSVA